MAVASADIEAGLAYHFQQPTLLEQALTHPSWLAEHERAEAHNQRLEFLGDAVLQLASSILLFEVFPDEDEGTLTRIRSALTKESTLAGFGSALGLGEAILLGKGEQRHGGAQRPSTLADAFEAVLGAIYLDGGLEPAMALVRRLVAPALADVRALLASENPKGALQEYTQEHYHSVPRYDLLKVHGPDHEPRFEVAVVFLGEALATAVAGSRRAAECQAAEAALAILQQRDAAAAEEAPPAPSGK